jgi:hypothetical protein
MFLHRKEETTSNRNTITIPSSIVYAVLLVVLNTISDTLLDHVAFSYPLPSKQSSFLTLFILRHLEASWSDHGAIFVDKSTRLRTCWHTAGKQIFFRKMMFI